MSLIIIVLLITGLSFFLINRFINAIKQDIDKQHKEIRKAIRNMHK